MIRFEPGDKVRYKRKWASWRDCPVQVGDTGKVVKVIPAGVVVDFGDRERPLLFALPPSCLDKLTPLAVFRARPSARHNLR